MEQTGKVDEADPAATAATTGESGEAPSQTSGDAVARGARRRGRRGRALVVVAAASVVALAAWLLGSTGPSSTTGAWLPTMSPLAVPGPYGPLLGYEEEPRSETPMRAPLPQPADEWFRYLLTNAQGWPVTWSPCRPIHYVVRTRDMPTDGLDRLQVALEEITTYSGLRFVYDGTTDEAPGAARAPYQPQRYGTRWAPVLVSWVTQAEDPFLDENVLGITYPTPMLATDGSPVLVSGQVEIGVAHLDAIREEAGVDLTHPVLLHELGHLVGLDHVDASSHLMNPTLDDQVDFAEDERQGLRSLGSGRCHDDV
jgi:hypothetical protein